MYLSKVLCIVCTREKWGGYVLVRVNDLNRDWVFKIVVGTREQISYFGTRLK